MPKDSFILYCDMYDSMRSLADAQKAQLLDAIFLFHRGEDLPEMDGVVSMCFSFLSRIFKKNQDKYLERCEKASASARMRWHAIGCERIKRNAFDADNDLKDSCLSLKSLPQSQETAFTQVGGGDAVSPTGSLSESKAGSKFVPPSLEEVSAYLSEKESAIDPEAFWAYYESKGWMVGKSKMKNWKAAVRTWEAKRKGESKPEDTSWHKYRQWAERYLVRRAETHPDTPKPTPQEIDSGAKVVASMIGPDGYTKSALSAAISWILADPERMAHVKSLAELADDSPLWCTVATWASNGARGVNVGLEPRAEAGTE